ncbi:hypothetical protein H8D85_01025 [bacterium]|nr:hypothetical protein [bacterium]
MKLVPKEHDNPAEEIADRIKQDAEIKAKQLSAKKSLDNIFNDIAESLDDIKTDL